MRGLLLLLVLLVVPVELALAHKLKVFATVDDGTISGYGFFVGGGRPQGARVVIKDATAREVFDGVTDAEGRFSWTPPGASDFTVAIDTREGHSAETRIAADRFAGAQPRPAAGLPVAGASPLLPPAGGDMERMVEVAVARQVRPVLERMEALDARLRVADIVSGICMILGLGGIGLWAVGRRSRPPGSGAA